MHQYAEEMTPNVSMLPRATFAYLLDGTEGPGTSLQYGFTGPAFVQHLREVAPWPAPSRRQCACQRLTRQHHLWHAAQCSKAGGSGTANCQVGVDSTSVARILCMIGHAVAARSQRRQIVSALSLLTGPRTDGHTYQPETHDMVRQFDIGRACSLFMCSASSTPAYIHEPTTLPIRLLCFFMLMHYFSSSGGHGGVESAVAFFHRCR